MLAAVYKSPSRDWSDTDINDLLSLRNKTVLAGYLNAKYPVWSSQISNRSGTTLLISRIIATFRYQHHEVPLTTHRQEMEVCWTSCCTGISEYLR
jgi:hypothetical protein